MDCPPTEAVEMEKIAYRIFKGEELKDDEFIPHVKLFPDNLRYKTKCDAHAISFFDTADKAREVYKEGLARNKNLGNFIAEVVIKQQSGKVLYTISSGHLSLWMYANWNPEMFEMTELAPIS